MARGWGNLKKGRGCGGEKAVSNKNKTQKKQKTQNSNDKIKQIKLKPKEYCHVWLTPDDKTVCPVPT